MILRFFIIALLITGMAACHRHNPSGGHNEAEGHNHNKSPEDQDGHAPDPTGEAHEHAKIQFTAYSEEFELFAEADLFTVGEKANVLSHFSVMPEFSALEEGKITMTLLVNGNKVSQTLDMPSRKGIYSFDIQPETAGSGTLVFEITDTKGKFEVTVPDVEVFSSHVEAHEAAESIVIPQTNATVFTKEQSWKIDFATGYPQTGPFGQVIKTTALVESTRDNEMVVTAKSEGIVLFSSNSLFEGKEIREGQSLFTISGKGFTDNNITVKYNEAKSNFTRAEADYARAVELAKDKIVSEKELLSLRNQYETTKAVFDNLSKNAGEFGQTIVSPLTGYVKQVKVENGSYVEAGQPVMVVSQNQSLVVRAEVPQRYANVLGTLYSANIQNLNDTIVWTLEQLKGKILAWGKSANNGNYLLPVTLQIENRGNFIPGSFVELYLKTLSGNEVLTVPETALLEEQGNHFVWVQITPELFEKREVKTGTSDGLHREITRGLQADERIVTRGGMLIKLSQAAGALDAHSGHVH